MMKLKDYKLLDWKEKKIQRQKKVGNNSILLLSLNRKISPPKEGRKNLVAVDNMDNIIWVAELPTKVYDSYFEMKYENGIIYAESSNSFVSEIDPLTGRILRKYMIK